MIGIPAEKLAAQAETESPGASSWERPFSPALDSFFSPELSDLHGVDAAPGTDAWRAAGGRAGRTLAVDPAWGEGYFWYYALDDCIAVSVYDVAYARPAGFDVETSSCFGLGSYGRGIVPYFEVDGQAADRTLLGYVWPGQRYRVDIAPGTRLDVTSIMLLEGGMARMAARLGRSPSAIAHAMALLDGTRAVPAVAHVLDEVRSAHVGQRMADRFYEAKVTEALCLLMDWYDGAKEGTRPLHAEDRAAIDRARAYLAENLGRTVGAEELARVALASPRKLARLFQKVEGCSPREYASGLRMERACELLRQGEKSMAEIASELGFSRQGSFSEAFRARFGCTPRAYRSTSR